MPSDSSFVLPTVSLLPSTVFLVDDDPPFLATAARFLRASGFTVKTFSSAAEFLNQREPEAAGCVVADLQMPAMNGIELQKALARSENPLPIIFLTGHGDIPTSVRAMRQGAEDFLTKGAAPEELLAAVQRALLRDRRDREQRLRIRELQALFGKLTPREGEVVEHVLRGQLNKQIAEDLSIAERSVKRHRTSIMSKLQVHSVAQLTQLAMEAQWPGNPGRRDMSTSSGALPSDPA
jgi:two-component system, LuxR family, response regulator FixJ